MLTFYLGVHEPGWLEVSPVPLFVSRRRMARRRRLPVAAAPWVLDSGAFSELTLYGEWRVPAGRYAAEIDRCRTDVGRLSWAAPQDWPCEPDTVQRTGLTIAEHQRRTIRSVLDLRHRLGTAIVAPVLQGWAPADFLRHVEAYLAAGIDLEAEPVVGVGSVCRRQDARPVLRALAPLPIHGFGVKGSTLEACSDVLTSADSLAWSFDARHADPLPGCGHRRCNNCLRYALAWRERRLSTLAQGRLFGPCVA